jgi:putative ABC transport system permease protein
VDVSPGWPVSVCLVILMVVTVVANRLGGLGLGRQSVVAGARAVACGVVPVVAIVLATGSVPLTGIAVIPVAGIVIGNTMTVHTLVGRRTFAALREEHGQYEASLSLGLTSSQAIDEIIARRVPEGIVPSLDQVRTSGVVTLPGAFIGVMLGGGSAVQAATAQVLVLFAIMATQSITASVQAELIRRRLLLPADLGSALVS